MDRRGRRAYRHTDHRTNHGRLPVVGFGYLGLYRFDGIRFERLEDTLDAWVSNKSAFG